MKKNINKASVKFRGKFVIFSEFNADFCLCPKSVIITTLIQGLYILWPGRVAQSVGHLTRKSGVLGSIPGLAIYFRFSFRFFKKGSCQLLAKVCARSTG